MNNQERIINIFDKTKKILYPVWADYENPQISHILYYLSLAAGYLKDQKEAKVFQKNWEEIKKFIKDGADKMDFLNQARTIESHLEQALREKSVHNPKDTRGIGIAKFYETLFPKLYQDAKTEYEKFQKRQDDMVKAMQRHHEEVFSSQEAWEAALERGDPMALVD